MPSIQEKLMRVYEENGGGANRQTRSWIPKRVASDPYEALRRSLPRSVDLSQARAEEILESQEGMEAARRFITEAVMKDLTRISGSGDMEIKMSHFTESWGKLFEKYGQLMILALTELAIGGVIFVGHEGYIKKVILREKVHEIEKTRRG